MSACFGNIGVNHPDSVCVACPVSLSSVTDCTNLLHVESVSILLMTDAYADGSLPVWYFL